MKLLVVTADDVGLHESMNLAAVQAHREGIVTACSVVANGNAFDHAVSLLKAEPTLDVGLHLAWVEEKPVLPVREVRSLTRDDKHFHSGFRSFVARYAVGRIDLVQLERESRAQIDKALAAGLTLRFLNSHQHLHALPSIFRMVEALAVEYGIAYVRLPVDAISGSVNPTRRLSLLALNALAARAGTVRRTRSATHTIGVAGAGHLTIDAIGRLLSSIEGSAELVVHPGLSDAGLSVSYDWNYEWEQETAALCSPQVRAALGANGVQAVSVREFLTRRDVAP